MQLTAKYTSVCPQCRGRIEPGTSVEWTQGQRAHHVTCPTTQRQLQRLVGFGSVGPTYADLTAAEIPEYLSLAAQCTGLPLAEIDAQLAAGRDVPVRRGTLTYGNDETIRDAAAVAGRLAMRAVATPRPARFTCPQCGEHRDTTRRGHCDDCE